MRSIGARQAVILRGVRLILRFGFPLLGLLVFGRAVVRSVGGDIAHEQFALGLVLILAGFTARLIPRG